MTTNDPYHLRLPNLTELQRSSFCWLLQEGLAEVIRNFSPISNSEENLEIHILSDKYKLKYPKNNPSEAIRKNSTYCTEIHIPVIIVNKEKKVTKEQEICFGELPLMTERGTFIINGTERVIINQIIRSPGIYYTIHTNSQKDKTYSGNLISNRGAWIKFELDKHGLIWARIDKSRRVLIHIFLKALGLTDLDIYHGVKNPNLLKKTFCLKGNSMPEAAFIELSSKFIATDEESLAEGQEIIYSRFFDPKRYDLGKVGRYKLNKKLQLSVPRSITVLTPQDILACIDYLINLKLSLNEPDNIDHLSNRRVRSVGELLQNQIRIGLQRLEKFTREQMISCAKDTTDANSLLNPKPIQASIREFFGSSQLSQFMDQTNPLAEITHKRRISALGLGGLHRDRIGSSVRDIHPSHYGRICPIETPEGQNAGLIGVLSIYARVNTYGFLETPFNKIVNSREIQNNSPTYLTADQEDLLYIAPADTITNLKGQIQKHTLTAKHQQEFIQILTTKTNWKPVSPIQTISIATSLIPFLEHNDANRSLMGSNMQRQAVPLLFPEKPLVGTGFEAQIARDSKTVVTSLTKGNVTYVSSKKVCIENTRGIEICYHLQKYERTNQDTCINQKPLVWYGDSIIKGQVIADGLATEGGELALGQNVLVAYMPWEGYNYEDAILVSDRLIYDNVYTSVHIEKYEIEARRTKLGHEEITKKVPNTSSHLLRNLDKNGIIARGSWVEGGDVLVGKITPKKDAEQPLLSKLMKAILVEKIREVKDTSLRMPDNNAGRILDVRVLTKKSSDEISTGANIMVRIYVAQTRKLKVGDKMAGRHGNKGIVSKILPRQDMPYLPDGTPIDIVLNPLGVPSRMNVGQIFECLLGLAAEHLGKRFRILPFDEMQGREASRVLINNSLLDAKLKTGKNWLFSLDHPGKMILYDGRTGEPFKNPITVGVSYILKLAHLVDDKMHARSTGPYSLVTQQPLGGKAQHGGQRLGEMEVWALEAYGASYTLQEFLTIKSDDMEGRNEALRAMIKGTPMPKPRTPESFKVLLKELLSLGLDVTAHKTNQQHKGIKNTKTQDQQK
ncbi:RNA polymerase beta subunit (plastid) [Cryptomonas paramecium]|uniref:DNA-directed RNA polymerase subunit beta n=1 Tax=Cryptomonas paramaecium TaxID=2898 RepID=D2IS80_9CRYP|nr:RNA polymerase beta subunit [Cryptomonas paramecium]ACT46772.1 RNA polymerase beta subunit [Cryptomonas paramecium]BDA98023.1 RNA polymerase beta subunit [Cryptomonas paramecium]